MHYVIDINTDRKATLEAIEAAVDDLAQWHVAAGETPWRTLGLTVTIAAESIGQAVETALRVCAAHGTPVSVSAVREDDRDARLGAIVLPELLSVTQAATALGVTRQRVLQMITDGKLPAQRVGNGWVVPASAVA